MGKLRAFSVAPQHAFGALTTAHAAGDAALFLDPLLPPALRDDVCADFGAASLTIINAAGATRSTTFNDAVTLADDTALVVLTSGSTGEPKGVELTHSALKAAVTQSLARLAFAPVHTVVQALPTHHIAGLLGGLRAKACGAQLLTCDSADALARAAGDLTALVPTQLIRLLETNVDLSRFGTILLGGAATPTHVIERARQRGATLVTSYGMSETCGGCVYDGVPLAGVEVAVDAPEGTAGRIRIRGDQLFRGYRVGRKFVQHPAGAWFVTSDAGTYSEGTLAVHGRLDRTAVSGGENVPLGRVEDAIRELDGVSDAFVFSRDDNTWGEVVLALVVADLSEAAIRSQLRALLPHRWLPRQIRTVAAVPQTGLGKPDRTAALRLF